MFVFFLKLNYNFTLPSIYVERKNFKYKCCYKKNLSFLALKTTPVQSICNRLMRHGLYLSFFKLIKLFFFKILIPKLLIPNYSYISFFFSKFPAIKDMDRVLNWRLSQNKSMFRFLIVKKKKVTTILKYIKPNKRHHTTLLWIKLLIKTQFNDKVLLPTNFKPLEQFILSEGKDPIIANIKLKIYKTYIIQAP